MSEADKLFYELGYRKIQVERNSIVYINIKYNEKIEFDLDYKQIICETNIGTSFPLTMQELQAINKKVEELGWVK